MLVGDLGEHAAVGEALRAVGASFALIFGSRARGDSQPDSDLDVAAWWPADAPNSWDIVLPANVDLVVLNDAPLELAGRIALEGQIMFDDDPPARVQWVATTRKIWLDEKPRFERAHREFLDAAADGR